MTERDRYRPFTGDTEGRIRLPNPPLALVLCQVRWPELTELQRGLDDAAVVISAGLGDYPLHERNEELSLIITPDGVTSGQGETVHRWRSVDGAWSVVLTKRSIALLSTGYVEFEEFSARLLVALKALTTAIAVPVLERVGLRYVNRIDDPADVVELGGGGLVNPEVLGLAALVPRSDDVVRITSINQALFTVGSDRLMARTGMLGAGETVDPSIPPVDRTSWVLDLDASRDAPGPFEPRTVIDVASRLADIDYDFFKFVTTERYLTKLQEGK